MSTVWTWKVEDSALSLREPRADKAILAALVAGEGNWTGEPRECSRSQLQKLMEQGHVTVDEEPASAGERLRPGTLVRIRFPAPRQLELIPEDRPLDILYEDEHLVVVNKPPGLTVHPSETQADGTLVHALLHHVRDLSGIGGVLRPGIVHRLDKDTSGALVVTKTDIAHQKLVEVFAAHAIERRYWAICYGVPKALQTRVESTIGRNPADRKKMAINVRGGRRAVTDFRVLESFVLKSNRATSTPFASLVEARLETGRTHQVRVHLTGLGHSILGDPVYGRPSERQPKWLTLPEEIRELVLRLPGQALHARVLGFEHPVTRARLRFEAPPPEVFRLLLEALESYSTPRS